MVLWDRVRTSYFPTCKFICGATVEPNSTLFLPYSTISLIVVQWDPVLPNYFPTCKFIHGGTVGPTSVLFLPYFINSSIVVQWDLSPLYFLPNDKVGPSPAKLLPYFMISSLVVQWGLPTISFCPSDTMGPSLAKIHIYIQIHPWWHSEIHLCSTYSLLHNFLEIGFSVRQGRRCGFIFLNSDNESGMYLSHYIFMKDLGQTKKLYVYFISKYCETVVLAPNGYYRPPNNSRGSILLFSTIIK